MIPLLIVICAASLAAAIGLLVWNGKLRTKVDLSEVRAEVEKLAQGMDLSELPQWRQTEAGRVAEWQESRAIEQDPEASERWLKRELALADEKWLKRERRMARRGEFQTLGNEVGVEGGKVEQKVGSGRVV